MQSAHNFHKQPRIKREVAVRRQAGFALTSGSLNALQLNTRPQSIQNLNTGLDRKLKKRLEQFLSLKFNLYYMSRSNTLHTFYRSKPRASFTARGL